MKTPEINRYLEEIIKFSGIEKLSTPLLSIIQVG